VSIVICGGAITFPKKFGPGPPAQCAIPGTMNRCGDTKQWRFGAGSGALQHQWEPRFTFGSGGIAVLTSNSGCKLLRQYLKDINVSTPRAEWPRSAFLFRDDLPGSAPPLLAFLGPFPAQQMAFLARDEGGCSTSAPLGNLISWSYNRFNNLG
jgi:hypothetical protein